MNNVKGILFTTWIFVSVYKTRGDEIIKLDNAIISSTGKVYANMIASSAIDGVANTVAETCRCCTVIQRPAQIFLNLTRPYWVSRIEVLSRTDSGSDQVYNIQLETAAQQGYFTSRKLNNGTYPLTVAEFDPPQLMQLIRINGTGNNNTYMAVCEITVWQNASGRRLLGLANQSSTYTENALPCLAANALNGLNNSDDRNLCSECSVTENLHPKWEVDLGGTFLIRSINVYGRNNTKTQHQTKFLQAFIRLMRDSTPVPVNNASSTFGLALLFTPPILARYVEIKQQDATNMYMTLCEVEIFPGACEDGFFGMNCTSPCHCQPGVKCNHTNGQCANMQCAAGWTGENCSAECEAGKFGVGCASECHCQNSPACNHVNGICNDNVCAAGWKSYNCSIECDNGYFGQKCSSVCHCRNISTCHRESGQCSDGQCASGFIGSNCSATCKDDFFGMNCTSPCHCQPGVKCNHTNGQCANMQCAAGWTGQDCSAAQLASVTVLQETRSEVMSITHRAFETMPGWSITSPLSANQKETNHDSTASLFAAIGALSMACGLLVATNVITFCIYLRQKKRTTASAAHVHSGTDNAYDTISSAERSSDNYVDLQMAQI